MAGKKASNKKAGKKPAAQVSEASHSTQNITQDQAQKQKQNSGKRKRNVTEGSTNNNGLPPAKKSELHSSMSLAIGASVTAL